MPGLRRLCAALLAVAVVVFGPAGPAQATVRTVGAGVPADCSSDVTAALESWLASTVADGDTVQFPDGACYRLDGTLDLVDRHNLTFVGLGAGATVKEISAPPATPKVENQMVSLVGGSGITFRNLKFQGTNTSSTFDVNREWWPTFEINGTSSVLIDNVDAVDVWGDFVQINPDTRPAVDVMANGVTLQNSSADRVGRHAVSCTGCDNVTVDGNAFFDVGYHVFDLEVEASGWHADNIWFTDNTVSGYLQHSILANAGIGQYITDVMVTGNTDTATHRTCTAPFWVLDTEPVKDRWTFTGNSIRNLGMGFDLAGMSAVTVESNTVDNLYGGCSNQEAGMHVAAVASGSVRFNNFLHATRIFAVGDSTAGIVKCGNTVNGATNRPVAC